MGRGFHAPIFIPPFLKIMFSLFGFLISVTNPTGSARLVKPYRNSSFPARCRVNCGLCSQEGSISLAIAVRKRPE